MEALHQIVAADRTARLRYASLRQETENMDVRLETLGRQWTEEAVTQAKADVEKARADSVAAAAETLAELDRKRDEALAQMKAKVAAEQDSWVETMFRKTVGLS
jgi:F0F1-type ATP synthase membrane subunit b/b'